jgi:2-(3-amino-3-carboxypropyl)histidine synthase
MEYSFDDAIRWAKENGYGKVLIQIPDGLIPHAHEIAEQFEKDGIKARIWMGGNFGACDTVNPKIAGCDALIHVGHAEMPNLKLDYPVYFHELRDDVDPIPAVEKVLGELKSPIGLISTVQHVHKLDEVKEFLREKGIEALIGMPSGRIKYPGQVLGCNFSSVLMVKSKVEMYLYIGTGVFHPLGAAMVTGKKVLALDPHTGKHEPIEQRERFLRVRYGLIAKAMDFERAAIIVSAKPGQNRMVIAEQLKGKAEDRGKKADILMMDGISPQALMGSGYDVYVSTACPRIALDDYMNYDRPILTVREFEVVLGIRKEWAMDCMI